MLAGHRTTLVYGYAGSLGDQWQHIVIDGCGGPDEWQAGFSAAQQLDLASVDAIQAHSDVVALGILAGLHERGVRVPEEVAVVGFDDRRAAQYAWPPLSTVAQPNQEIGSAAARALLQCLSGDVNDSVSISTTYIKRATT